MVFSAVNKRGGEWVSKVVEVFWLAGEGDYRPVAADATGRMGSKVLPGFWLHPAWLWEEPLPAALEKLAALEASTM